MTDSIRKAQDEQAMEHLGSEIRALRKSLNMTLEDLADKTNLSVGFLSLVERGKKRPSVPSLQNLSKALNVEVGWFFPPHPSEDPVERKYVVRKDYRRRVDYSRMFNTNYLGQKDYMLSPSIEGDLAMTLMRFEPGMDSGDDIVTHLGQESGYVLSGILTLEVEGKRLTLHPGDSFGLNGSTPHRYINEGDEMLEVIIANTPALAFG